jgi:hypothetical protein
MTILIDLGRAILTVALGFTTVAATLHFLGY